MGGGLVDYDKTAELVIREIRSEKFGPLSFERPSDFIKDEEGNSKE
jgi:ribosome biogenesis GTPase A